jgi:hypothetical protein
MIGVVGAVLGIVLAVVLLRLGVSEPVGLVGGALVATAVALGYTSVRPHEPADIALAVLTPVALYIPILLLLFFIQAVLLGGVLTD